MSLYSLIAIIIFIASLIAVKQKIRGLRFWSSFFISLIVVASVLGIVWKILS